MDERLKEILSMVLTVILVFSVYFGLRVVLHTKTPLVVVASGSMRPVFYPGDVVLLKGVKPEEIKVGDVIVYKSAFSKYPIIHRVRGIKQVYINGKPQLCFITWGDNNPVPDLYELPNGGIIDCVPSYAVEAKALIVFPKIGIISIKVRELLGIGG
ncbi:signal peptidase I [Pyrococcus abyssi]|uniref:Signal peptidase n=1 Tax=Pyrococcus abyssi (strain GE5 / Orsay) TaxID=272844 RepID=Q9UYQ4_PYRAB|nr:signal peptidase I [Pyrococcus abyssi]CAB50358.1 Signal peptidase [Pyrococcus abyssi GE5]CCE70899.1 TPA: signal peptidase [Pyrococcus abyssi GE5]